jgi:sRNA-binding protein
MTAPKEDFEQFLAGARAILAEPDADFAARQAVEAKARGNMSAAAHRRVARERAERAAEQDAAVSQTEPRYAPLPRSGG